MTLLNTEHALKALQLIDLTSLNENDTDEKIIALCQDAQTSFAKVAAVCVYPQFIRTAKKQLAKQGCTEVKIATVTNFPQGNTDIALAAKETHEAIALGADEIDVVFPYRALIKGDSQIGFRLIDQCKTICGDKTLKVIIETGVLKKPELIKKASEVAISAGADFIKTSTGKVPENATLESAKIVLNVIKNTNVGTFVGFKAASEVKTAKEASEYLNLAVEILGKEWVNASHFRFSSSSLLNDLLITLDGKQKVQAMNLDY